MAPVTFPGAQQGQVHFSSMESLLSPRAGRQAVCLCIVHGHLQSRLLKIPPSTQHRPGLPQGGES